MALLLSNIEGPAALAIRLDHDEMSECANAQRFANADATGPAHDRFGVRLLYDSISKRRTWMAFLPAFWAGRGSGWAKSLRSTLRARTS